jgi:hypothetical protein
MTVRQLAADYIERHAIPHKKPSSLKEDRRMLKAHVLPALGKLRVSAVRRGDVEKLLNPLKPAQSNRVRSLLLHMFSLAVRWNLGATIPATGSGAFPRRGACAAAARRGAVRGDAPSRTTSPRCWGCR